MGFKVTFSNRADNDLEDIIRHIRDELHSPQAAERFFKSVDEKCKLLREHPHIYSLYHDEKLSAEGYRFAVIGNYLMFYLVDDAKSVVTIVRILYGKQDIPSVFAD